MFRARVGVRVRVRVRVSRVGLEVGVSGLGV